MGFRYICDLCHKTIKDRRALTAGGHSVGTVYAHPECAPELVDLLRHAKARGLEEFLSGDDVYKRLERLQATVEKTMTRDGKTETEFDQVLKEEEKE